MCKVMMIAGIKTEHIPKVYTLTKNMAKAMSVIEDDGVGYAAITRDGQVYGEKWLNKDEAFVVHNSQPADPAVEMIDKMFGRSIDWDKPPATGNSYTSFGNKTQENINNTVALILHARKATNGSKTLENVHPFVKSGIDGEPLTTALIHNGSILNHDKLTKESSTCDSEVILHEYLGNMMYHNPWGIKQLSKTLVGTYTVGVLSSQLVDDVWVPYLDIFKSNRELVGGYVPEIETMVFATTQYILENTVKDSGMSIKHIFKLKDGYLHRLNAITGLSVNNPIDFITSSQHMNGWNRQHEHSAASLARPVVIRDVTPRTQTSFDDIDKTDDISKAKEDFERRHPSLFTTPYLESEISSEEKSYFDELEKNKQTDHKALRLVSAALNIGRPA